MKFGRLSKPCAALIAVVAIAASAQSAKADLYVDIAGPGGPQRFNYSEATKDPTTGFATASFDGFTVTYKVTEAAGAGSQSLTLSATVTKTPVGASPGLVSFSFQAYSHTFDGSSVSSVPTGATPSAGAYNPLGGAGYDLFLSTALGVTTSAGSGIVGSVTASSNYTAYNGTTVIDDRNDQSVVLAAGSPSSETNTPAWFTHAAGTTGFDLRAIAVTLEFTPPVNGTVAFNATSMVALPEPSGVAAAFAGLPCMGLLVRLVRRRSGTVSA